MLEPQPRPPRPRGEPAINAPKVVWALLVLFAFTFVIFHVQSTLTKNVWAARFGVWPARFTPDGAADLAAVDAGAGVAAALASLVSYTLLHGDLAHLVVNGLWFLAFATAVARRQDADAAGVEGFVGTARFLCFFFLCGAAGGVAHILINFGEREPLFGASGAIAGLMAATSRFIARPKGAALAPLNAPTVVGFAAAWTLINAATALGGLMTPELRLISWEAHLGGYFAGLLVIPLFDGPVERDDRIPPAFFDRRQ